MAIAVSTRPLGRRACRIIVRFCYEVGQVEESCYDCWNFLYQAIVNTPFKRGHLQYANPSSALVGVIC
jgi:hypothetical protein